MAEVYILHSKSLNRYYIGSCRSLGIRLEQHKNKVFPNSFTTKANDWEVFYNLSDLTLSQARNIESHIKKMKSKTFVANIKKYPEIAQRLLDQYQEGSSR